MPDHLQWKWPRLCAVGGMALVALVWAVLAVSARPLDLGLTHLTYWGTGMLFVIGAGIFAYSLNAQQAEEIQNDADR